LLNKYKAYSAASEIMDETNKPKLLLKVFHELLDKIEIIKAAVSRKDYEKKCEELARVTTVLEVLQGSLDMSRGEISTNLANIYGYLIKRLREIHRTISVRELEECKQIVVTIHEAFVKAYEQEQAKPSARNPAITPMNDSTWV
jgi:flagellar biosynthetic protein FliS